MLFVTPFVFGHTKIWSLLGPIGTGWSARPYSLRLTLPACICNCKTPRDAAAAAAQTSRDWETSPPPPAAARGPREHFAPLGLRVCRRSCPSASQQSRANAVPAQPQTERQLWSFTGTLPRPRSASAVPRQPLHARATHGARAGGSVLAPAPSLSRPSHDRGVTGRSRLPVPLPPCRHCAVVPAAPSSSSLCKVSPWIPVCYALRVPCPSRCSTECRNTTQPSLNHTFLLHVWLQGTSGELLTYCSHMEVMLPSNCWELLLTVPYVLWLNSDGSIALFTPPISMANNSFSIDTWPIILYTHECEKKQFIFSNNKVTSKFKAYWIPFCKNERRQLGRNSYVYSLV